MDGRGPFQPPVQQLLEVVLGLGQSWCGHDAAGLRVAHLQLPSYVLPAEVGTLYEVKDRFQVIGSKIMLHYYCSN